MDLSTRTRWRAHADTVRNEANAVALSMDLIRDLALRQPGTPVLSVYVRTDPRDPANTAVAPRWLVELRNSLREVSRTVDMRESRERRMTCRELQERVEADVLALEPAERGRGLAWFRTADGALDHRFTLQLPPAGTLVRWDDRPYVSPLADVADRSRPVGLVLVSAEAVRLLHWQGGRVTEPAQSLYEIEPGQWRDYAAYVGYPGRSPAGRHVAEFDQRVREWRQRFLRTTAQAVAGQVTDLGWHRILLVGEPRVTEPFLRQLSEPASGQVAATINANLIWADHAAVAERLDDAVPHTQAALGWPPPQLLVERAIEQAVISGAEVTVLPANTPELVRAGGAGAILRY